MGSLKDLFLNNTISNLSEGNIMQTGYSSDQKLNISHSLESIKNRWKIKWGTQVVRWRENQQGSNMVAELNFARRAVISSGIAHAGHGAKRQEVKAWLKNEGLWGFCTDWEKQFLVSEKPKPSDSNEASWRIERLWVFSWAKGDFDHLDHGKPCGPGLSISFPRPGDRCQPFIDKCRLRSDQEIQKERCQLAYMNEILEKEGELPPEYDEGIVLERLHAFNWLTTHVDVWPDGLWK